MAKYAGQYDLDVDENLDWKEQYQAESQKLQELLDASDQLDLEQGEMVGGVLSWPVADGKAFYIVTNDDPLTLMHIPIGDAYHIRPAELRGLNRQDVLEHLHRRAALRDLFSKPSKS